MLLYQKLAFKIHGKIQKSHTKIINSKYQLRHGMESLNYLMGQILYQIFCILKIKERLIETNNPSIRTSVNKIENINTFKLKRGYYLELSTSELMKLLGSTKAKINKNKNGENVSHLEITEVLLVYCNIVNTDWQEESCIHLFQIFWSVIRYFTQNIVLHFYKHLIQSFHILKDDFLIKILNRQRQKIKKYSFCY